ncbi:MAG: DNA cytosine methyltransferase [Geitlerinemataceae cyanobacterium]
MLNQLDLCSRIGSGFPLAGLQIGGLRLCGLAEMDLYCRDILSKRFPGIPNYGNLKTLLSEREKISFKISETINLITAVPPKQAFCKLRGISDPKDCLFDIIRVVGKFQPNFWAIETVPELLKCPYEPQSKTAYAYYFFREIDRLGYDAEWLVVSSGQWGSPLRRERLLLVGYSRELFDSNLRPRTWVEQFRNEVETVERFVPKGVSQSDPARGLLQFARRLDRPLGVPSGYRTHCYSKKALESILDPRIAAIALRRILYLNSLIEE